jgi:hypothetical protein
MPIAKPTKIIDFLHALVRGRNPSDDQWKLLFQHPYRPELPHEYDGPKAVIVDIRRRDVFMDWLHEAKRRAAWPLRWDGDRNSYGEALQGPEPDNYFELELRLFRAHLRAIWEADHPEARAIALKAMLEYAAMPRTSRELPGQSDVTWNSELFKVITWLVGNCDSLKICANGDCDKSTRYFIRVTGYKYCSDECRGEGDSHNHAARKAEREANGPPRQQRTYSDKAKQKIKGAQKKRWEKVRA